MADILNSRLCERESQQRPDSGRVTPSDQGCSSSRTQPGSTKLGTATYPVEIGDWTRVEGNSIRGVFTLTLTTIGLTIKGCMLRRGFDGNYFVAMPALPQVSGGRLRVDEKGRISYRSVLQFSDKESYRRFETVVLETLNRHGLIEACPQEINREG